MHAPENLAHACHWDPHGRAAAMTRGRLLLVVKGAVALVLIGWLASSVDRAALAGVLRRIQPVPLAALVAVALLMVGVSCWKWSLLLRAQGIRLPATYLLKTYFVGYFFTNFLPTGIGGDAVRALRVGQASGRRGASLLAVFFERFTGLVVLLTWVALLPLFNPAVRAYPPVLALVALAACGLAAALLAAWQGDRLYRLAARLLPRGFVAEKAALLARHFHEFRMGGRFTAQVMAVTVLFYALTFVNVLLGFAALGIEVPAREVATWTPVVMFISMVPFSISSIGITEGAYVWCFLLAGVPREASLGVALLMRLKLVLLGVAGGVVYLTERNAPPPGTGAPPAGGAG
jgi:hypothetical protein